MGTEEALAALDRIENEAKKVTLTPEKVAMGVWPHAVGHFEVGRVEPITQVRTPNGTTYGVVVSGLLGGFDFYLVWTKTPQDATSWSRPRLLPQRVFPGIDKPVLTAKDDDHLVLSYNQRKPPKNRVICSRRHILFGATFRIRLSDKTSRGGCKTPTPIAIQAKQAEAAIKVRIGEKPAPTPPNFVLVAQPPTQPGRRINVEPVIGRRNSPDTKVVGPPSQ